MPLPQSPDYKYYPTVLGYFCYVHPITKHSDARWYAEQYSHHSYYCHDYNRTNILSNFQREDNG